MRKNELAPPYGRSRPHASCRRFQASETTSAAETDTPTRRTRLTKDQRERGGRQTPEGSKATMWTGVPVSKRTREVRRSSGAMHV